MYLPRSSGGVGLIVATSNLDSCVGGVWAASGKAVSKLQIRTILFMMGLRFGDYMHTHASRLQNSPYAFLRDPFVTLPKQPETQIGETAFTNVTAR